MTPLTASSPVNFDVVAITWDDAVSHEGLHVAQDLDALVHPVPVTTIGYLVRETDHGFVVASELHDYPYEQQWSGVSFIPKGMVRGVQRLGGMSA